MVSGGLFHGIQLWVNLPAASKWVEPRYQDIEPRRRRAAGLGRRRARSSGSSPATSPDTAARA